VNYQKNKKNEWKEKVFSRRKGVKRPKNGGSGDKEEENKDVIIQLGLMEWSEKNIGLKPKYGKRVALRVSKSAPYHTLLEKANERWKDYYPNFYSEEEQYVLLLDNCKEALFLPGSSKEFFSLKRYQEELGKDFKRIVLYLCTESHLKLNENSGLEPEFVDSESNEGTSEESEVEEEEKRNKRHKVSDKEMIEEIEKVEEFLQTDKTEIETQIANEITSNKETEVVKEYESTASVVKELQANVDRLHTTARRGIPFERIITLWCRAASRMPSETALKVTYLGEDGNDTGALGREFLTTAIAQIGQKLFPEGSPIESTHYVQNGTYIAAGELVAASIAQGGPPPNFLQDCVFNSLVNTTIDVQSPHLESHLTTKQK